MKIAVTSTGRTLDSQVDPRFGRAQYIIIADTVTMNFEVLENQANISAVSGAGIGAAASIVDRQVEYLMTGYCGPKAFKVLEAAGVKVINDTNGTVELALQQLEHGSFRVSEGPNARTHWK